MFPIKWVDKGVCTGCSNFESVCIVVLWLQASILLKYRFTDIFKKGYVFLTQM